jgi:hypothetical protein
MSDLSHREFHADALVRAPRSHHRDLGVIDSPHADVNVFPGVRCIRAANDLVVAGLIGQPVADPQQHGEDTSCASRIGRQHPR